MAKNSNEVKETAQEAALARVAAEQWNDYQAKYKPFENSYMKDVLADTKGREEKVQGMVSADVAQKMSSNTRTVDPNKAGSLGAKQSMDRASALSKGQVVGAQSIRDQQTGAMQTLIDMGRGQATQAQDGMGSLAVNATNTAINDAATRQQNRAATGNLIGSAIGAGASMYGSLSAPKLPDTSVSSMINPMQKYAINPEFSAFSAPSPTVGPLLK